MTVENVQELMVAADMLQLNEVVSICGEFLKGHMDPSNCVGIFQFLEQIACIDMLEFTENYIHVHFLEVCNNERHCMSFYLSANTLLLLSNSILFFPGKLKLAVHDICSYPVRIQNKATQTPSAF